MDDLDELLARVVAAPVHPGLPGIEGPVFARIAAAPRASASAGVGAALVMAALGMGVAGAALPAQTESAGVSLAPLGANAPLVPSTLLVGDQ